MNRFRQIIRTLCKSPSFTTVVLATMGLTIGANVTLFSLVDAVLLKPLPYEDPDRILALWDSNPSSGWNKFRVSPANYLAWKDQNTVFEETALYGPASFRLQAGGEPVQLSGTRVTQGYFPLLGVRARLGRTLGPADFEASASDSVVLSHSLWSDVFGSDPQIVGQDVRLDDRLFRIVGVLPRQIMPVQATHAGRLVFSSAERRLWIPFKTVPDRRSNHVFGALAKLDRRVGREKAQAQLDTISARLAEEFPRTNANFTVRMIPLLDEAVGDVRTPMLLLLGAVLLVLVVAVANVANLVVVRSQSRRREFALRNALGATARRQFRETVIEGALLTFSGSVIGSAIGMGLVRVLPQLNPGGIPRLDEASFSGTVLLGVVGLTLMMALLFGLVPLWTLVRSDLFNILGGSARGGVEGGRGAPLRRLLVALEMTVAVMLMIGAGLLLKSFYNLTQVHPGFSETNVLALDFLHSAPRYNDMAELNRFYDRLFEFVESQPGVHFASAAYDDPLSSNWTQGFRIIDTADPQGGVANAALFRTITPGYFETLGIQLLEGRAFRDSDEAGSGGVVIINDSMRRRYFSGQEPLGRSLRVGTTQWMWGDSIPTEFRIVGIVEDIKFNGLESTSEPAFYLPFRQTPQLEMTVFIRCQGDPLRLLPSIRRYIHDYDPSLPIAASSTVGSMLSESVAKPRLSLMMLGGFAATSLFLTLVGLWGVLNYIVRRQTYEIGVRLALGAQRSDVFRITLASGIWPALAGLVAGLGLSLAFGRTLASMLYGVSPADTPTYLIVGGALLTVSLLACSVPAWRAAGTDPLRVLKYE